MRGTQITVPYGRIGKVPRKRHPKAIGDYWGKKIDIDRKMFHGKERIWRGSLETTFQHAEINGKEVSGSQDGSPMQQQ